MRVCVCVCNQSVECVHVPLPHQLRIRHAIFINIFKLIFHLFNPLLLCAGGHSGHIRWHAIPRHATPLHRDGARLHAGLCNNICAQLSVRQAVLRGNPRTTRWLSGTSHYTWPLHAISKPGAKVGQLARAKNKKKGKTHCSYAMRPPKQLTAESSRREQKNTCAWSGNFVGAGRLCHCGCCALPALCVSVNYSQVSPLSAARLGYARLGRQR